MSNKTFNWDKHAWNVIDDVFFNQPHVIAKNQIDSFDNMNDQVLPQIVEQHNPIMVVKDVEKGKKTDDNSVLKQIVLKIQFGQIYSSKPLIQEAQGVVRPLFPQEARIRNLNYWSSVYIDIQYEYTEIYLKDGKEQVVNVYNNIEKRVPFTKMHIMLKSKFCHLQDMNDQLLEQHGEDPADKGGYFIVKGSEKVIIAQERVVDNKVLCFKQTKATSKFLDMVEVKSTIDQRFYPVKNVTLKLMKDTKAIRVGIQHIKQDIPLFILFRALNIITDKAIMSLLLYNLDENVNKNKLNLILPSVMDAVVYGRDKDKPKDMIVQTQDEALEYISRYLNWTDYRDEQTKEKDKKYKQKYVLDIINREFLPHVGTSLIEKAYFLGYMTNVLLECHLGIREYDDRDHYTNKRVDTAGALLSQIIRSSFQKLVRDIKSYLSKELNENNINNKNTDMLSNAIRKVIQNNTIESKIKYALSTGNWIVQSGASIQSRAGIAQVLQRLTYPGYISHLRRIQAPLEKAGSKLIPPRKLRGCHWGMTEPNETPEGGQVGVVKNQSLGMIISYDSSTIPVLIALSVLKKYIRFIADISPSEVVYSTKLLLNGKWVAIVHNTQAELVYNQLKNCKRVGIIKPFISIYWNVDYGEIIINTDGGRYMRPVFTVSKSTPQENTEKTKWELDIAKVWSQEFYKKIVSHQIKWKDLLLGTFENNSLPNNVGVIEYIDTNETMGSMIAMDAKELVNNSTLSDKYVDYTHCEINANLIFGVVTPIIPFSDHNPAPRNCYEDSMGKQAIGIYANNFNSRLDTMGHILCCAQKPLIYNRMIKHFYLNSTMPHGFQAMVAIATYSGFNQEDSIILNQSAIDRGFGSSLFFRTYKDEQQKYKSPTSSGQFFGVPDKNNTKEMKAGNYDYLDDNGIVKKNSQVQEFDVLIGKIAHLNTKTNDSDLYDKKDVSTTVRSNEKGNVDLVFPSKDDFDGISNIDAEGNEIAKVRLCELRKPEIGDKFASRAAQKGTVGMIYRQEDMPFTKNGEVPDIIMNPHAIPSRMTVNQLIEDLIGKACILTGGLVHDATNFTELKVDELKQILVDNGLDENCDEQLYNGFTGETLHVKTFFGPVYYQKLKHMVIDKVHSRNTGPNTLLTRQPAEGRSRDGGLRLGEMERDVLISHGAPQFLKERFMESSDGFSVYVSQKDGDIIVANPNDNYYKHGDNELRPDEVSEVQLPFACKLLLQEINSMGIYTKLVT